MSPIKRTLTDGDMWSVKALLGESVFEPATMSIRDGWLTIEFDRDDLDSMACPLPSEDQHASV